MLEATHQLLSVTRTRAWPLLVSVALAACASTPEGTEPDATATAESTATAEATSVPTTQPTAEASTTATETPTATAKATGRPPSGRTPMTMEGKEKVTGTFAESPAAKLTISSDQSVLRIPEYALHDAVNVTFMIDKKPPKKAKGGAGQVYRLMVQRPPSEETSSVSSQDPKFQLRLPSAKLATPNLAVGEITKDDKGKETVTWKVVAPTKTEEGFATYEITDFGNTLLQVTSEAPG